MINDFGYSEKFIPAKVYDAIRQSAEENGGVGSGQWFKDGAPYCLFGHAQAASPKFWKFFGIYKFENALIHAGVNTHQNDIAVLKLGYSLDRGYDFDRLPFDAVAKRMNLVRVE